MKPREVDRLRPRLGSRPASDTDDTLWEELLQGPDSASTESSDSEVNGRYNAGLTLPPTTTLSSDDESLQQGIAGVRSTINLVLCGLNGCVLKVMVYFQISTFYD